MHISREANNSSPSTTLLLRPPDVTVPILKSSLPKTNPISLSNFISSPNPTFNMFATPHSATKSAKGDLKTAKLDISSLDPDD